MSRLIDADALIADMQERYCKPCKERKEDYNEVRCRACWVDDAIGDVDGFADNTIDAVSEWIPCEERLPSKDGKYLIVGRQGAVNILPYHDGMWYGRWGVIAWMPLPKPYREREGE